MPAYDLIQKIIIHYKSTVGPLWEMNKANLVGLLKQPASLPANDITQYTRHFYLRKVLKFRPFQKTTIIYPQYFFPGLFSIYFQNIYFQEKYTTYMGKSFILIILVYL